MTDRKPQSSEPSYALLTNELAQDICDILYEETGYSAMIANQNGTIVAATEKERIGSFHEIAKKIMDGELEEAIIRTEDAAGQLPAQKKSRPQANKPARSLATVAQYIMDIETTMSSLVQHKRLGV